MRALTLCVLVALTSSACSLLPSEDAGPPEPLTGWSSTSLAPASDTATNDEPPDAIGLVDVEETGVTLDVWPPDTPRRNNEGIEVVARLTEFDFGNGNTPATEILGDHAAGSAGVYLPGELTASTDSLDVLGWSFSGGTFVALFEVGPAVSEVRLSSTQGGVDRVAPSAEGTAVLGVRATDVAQVSVEALTAAGDRVAVCSHDGTFFDCQVESTPDAAPKESTAPEPLGTERWQSEEPRLTSEGISIYAHQSENDYGAGDGVEPAIALYGEFEGAFAGSHVRGKKVSTTDTLGVLGWSLTNDTFVVLAETGSSVAEVRLTSPAGGVDRVVPGDDYTAALAVFTDDLPNLTLEAFNIDGDKMHACVYIEDKYTFVCDS